MTGATTMVLQSYFLKYKHIILLLKIFTFIQVAFMGDRRVVFNSLRLSYRSSDLPIASQEFAPRN